MQRSRVKLNNQGKKITFWELKRRCQLVIRLKANKYYQELLYSLSSYINLLNLLNLQGLRNWLLVLSQFQNSSPWSRPPTNSDLKGGIYNLCLYSTNCLVSWLRSDHSQMSCLLCRNLTVLGWVAWPWSLGRLMVLGCLLVLVVLPIGSSICERSKTKSICK